MIGVGLIDLQKLCLNRLASNVKNDLAVAKDIARLGAITTDFSLTYTDYTQDNFTITWDCSVDLVVGDIITQPGTPLKAGSTESLS